MNPVSTLQETWPRRVHSKIVGTTFEGRQNILEKCKRQGVTELKLVRDPMNRYDAYAVAVEAELTDRSGSRETVRLGFLSNSDRVCSDCGQPVGGSLFDRSRTLKCGDCEFIFGYGDPTVVRRGSIVLIECPQCGESVDLGLCKVVTCPECGGNDFGRGGMATRFSRALAGGVKYQVKVVDYTGGDTGRDGRPKALGCNIQIEQV